MSYHLIDIVQKLGNPRVLVLGDLILDRYIWGDAERVSQEAPVILLRADREEERLGGAANVAQMLRGLDAVPTLAGVVGNDGNANRVRDLLAAQGIDASLIAADPTRPTTVKERFIGRAQHRHPHQMLRVDREDRRPLDIAAEDALLARLLPMIAEHQAILVSDYAKGVCTPRVLREVIRAARQANVPCVVDPYPGEDYQIYRGATAVTPNRLETRRATGVDIRTEAEAFTAGNILCRELDLDYAFVTLDSDGIALVRADGTAEMLPTRKREVYDITGAGDMALAMIGVSLAAGVAPADALRLGNIAAGLEVEKVGVAVIPRAEIRARLLEEQAAAERERAAAAPHFALRAPRSKILPLAELSRQAARHRAAGEKIVFTNGCFDLLHVGHVSYLAEARALGDLLIVGLNSDNSVRRLKGSTRPVIGECDRAAMLAAMAAVDYVVIFDEPTPHHLLHNLRPDVLVKGGTYRPDEVVGHEVVEAYGGQVGVVSLVEGVSTTAILASLADRDGLKEQHFSAAADRMQTRKAS